MAAVLLLALLLRVMARRKKGAAVERCICALRCTGTKASANTLIRDAPRLFPARCDAQRGHTLTDSSSTRSFISVVILTWIFQPLGPEYRTLDTLEPSVSWDLWMVHKAHGSALSGTIPREVNTAERRMEYPTLRAGQ